MKHILVFVFLIVSVIPMFGADSNQINWTVLLGYDWEEGEANASVQDLVGQRVIIWGYAYPVEQGRRGGTFKTFYFMPVNLSCSCSPPPEPNQVLYVIAEKDIRGSRLQSGQIKVEGVLTLIEGATENGDAGYELLDAKIVR